jgi:PIN domain nuclease of toxin-antitoxin system
MKLLLDSHTLIWALIEPARLPAKVSLSLSDSKNEVSVSAVSFWEIALKVALGKLMLENVSPEGLRAKSLETGFNLLPLDPVDAASFNGLPRMGHKDPFDRMLVWLAIRGGYTMVSGDAGLRVYEAHGLKMMWGK